MMSTFADHPWLHGRVPNGFWDRREHRIQYIRWLGEHCGFHKPEDWYVVRKSHFKSNCGGGLLCTQYQDSVYAALREYYPDYDWLPWRFHSVPPKFWTVPENRYRYMAWLEKELGFTQPEDWYGVVKHTFSANYGGGLLHGEFGDSVSACVRDYLPDYNWLAWKFRDTPNRFWQEPENRRAYMSWLGAKLGFVLPSDWYRITKTSFYDNHGAGLLRTFYQDSPQRAVREILPEMDWKPWLFTSVPQRFWHAAENRLYYLRWLGQQLGLRQPPDWSALSARQLRQHHGAGLLEFYATGAAGLEVESRKVARRYAGVWPLIVRVECTLSGQDPQWLTSVLA